jgi:tripartite-type tricarboxylate transporter receptor subunit TctC
LFKTMTGVNMVHVPYKGAAPAMADLVAGQVQLIFIDNLVAAPLVSSGRLRAIAVTSPERSPLVPTLAPVSQAVPGFSVVGWVGLFAPAGTPADVIRRIHDEVRTILALPDVRERLVNMGPAPSSSTPEEFAAVVQAEVKKWAQVVKDSGAKAD